MSAGNFIVETLHSIQGIELASIAAGIKKSGDDDLVLIKIDQGAQVVAAFTQNLFCAAPVIISKQHLATNKASRCLLINSGNANAGTGQKGIDLAMRTIRAVGDLASCSTEQVLVFSTGVIGELLPSEKITQALPALFAKLHSDAWLSAAQGIMTTDTYAKAVSEQINIDGKVVSITGIAKGSGMIKPNMATLLSFIATDADVPSALLQQLLNQGLHKSFNAVTIDGDTSTNDSCVLIATGASQVTIDGSSENALQTFQQALENVLLKLAQALVRDGEGATKFVEVRVEKGDNVEACKQVAYSIAQSPLVKTALFASDPNWGRILAAVGNAGVPLNVEKVDLLINDVLVLEQGALAKSYTEEQGAQVMQEQDIVIRIILNQALASHCVWTSDLSYDYVKINAEYRS